jgi:hypothetical protein
MDDMSLNFHILAKLIALALVSQLAACYPNNPTQNQRLEILRRELISRNLVDGDGKFIKILGLRAFSNICFWQKPAITPIDCLSMVIEADSLDKAKTNCESIIISLKFDKLDTAKYSQLSKAAVVLIPAVRSADYSGGVNGYAINNYFETASPYIFKFGEKL